MNDEDAINNDDMWEEFTALEKEVINQPWCVSFDEFALSFKSNIQAMDYVLAEFI